MAEFKVVVPLDGSPLAETSLKYLPSLKSMGDLRVRLVAVVETHHDAKDMKGADEFFERERRLLVAYNERMVEQLQRDLGVPIEEEVRIGPADEEIKKTATEAGADLVVITTHGRSGVGRWAIGSVADKLLREADRPTLVIGPKAAEREQPLAFNQILAPLDGSELAEKALDVASSWAKALSARLHLMRVVTLPAVYGTESATLSTPDLFDAMQDAAQLYIDRMKARAGLPDTATTVTIGIVADELMTYAGENGIGLVVMTSRGHGGVLRAVLGSITDRLLHGPAPVLVIPAA